MPSSRRKPNIDPKPRATAVADVKIDHQTTATVYEMRGPTLSTNQPDGSWNDAYVQKKAPRMRPDISGVKPNSFFRAGSATPRLARSM